MKKNEIWNYTTKGPRSIGAGTEGGEPADRAAWLPRGFLFLWACLRPPRVPKHACALCAIANRSAARYATTGATAILARRPGTSTEFVPVVHGTGTLMQGPFETRNTNLGSWVLERK